MSYGSKILNEYNWCTICKNRVHNPENVVRNFLILCT